MMLLANVIHWPPDSRLSGVSGCRVGVGPGLDGVVSLHLVDLPDGQQGAVEMSMAHALLPFAGSSMHGTYPDGAEWMLLTQVAVVDPGRLSPSKTKATDLLRSQLDRYARVNPGADVQSEVLLDRPSILTGYTQRGIAPERLANWTLEELLAGLVCDMCNSDLDTVVQGRDTGCSLEGIDHFCTGNGFTDIFAQWSRGLMNTPPAVTEEQHPIDPERETPIQTTDLIEVPGPDADLPTIMDFALTYNGYQRFDGPLGEFANTARNFWTRLGQMPWDLDSLRAALFYEQRRHRHLENTPSSTDMDYLHALISAIRMKAGDQLPGPPDPLP
jgi:hypothetical protein